MKKKNERDQKMKSKKEPSFDKGNPRQEGIGLDTAIGNLLAQLIDTIEKSSKATIKLTEKIKCLTWILVILGTIGLIMAGFSLYMQYFRN